MGDAPPPSSSTALQAAPPSDAPTKGQAFLLTKAAGILMAGEEVYAVASQSRWARYFFLPTDGVVVTSHRVLLLRCGFFSLNFSDYHWEHVEDVHIANGLKGASFTVTATTSKSGYATKAANQQTITRSMPGLQIEQAQRAYVIAQQMENVWRERVRQRIIEERRAEHGHVVVQSAGGGRVEGVPGQSPPSDPYSRLKMLKAMLDDGLITHQEYAAKKAELLASM